MWAAACRTHRWPPESTADRPEDSAAAQSGAAGALDHAAMVPVDTHGAGCTVMTRLRTAIRSQLVGRVAGQTQTRWLVRIPELSRRKEERSMTTPIATGPCTISG